MWFEEEALEILHPEECRSRAGQGFCIQSRIRILYKGDRDLTSRIVGNPVPRLNGNINSMKCDPSSRLDVISMSGMLQIQGDRDPYIQDSWESCTQTKWEH
ncbi:hypothetical protein CEXT_681671 [Caerostris extrusa]|uniref:Uncharacterized protein n=1 Tax=Caerostris extrusa TaxID=172846 RepID=A0AAV4Y6U1_CAEEX|nr:hypothetical protein CEXT_681671 [Caerostris extrusa]